MLGELLLHHTDNLGRTLQKSDISTIEGQTIVGFVMKTLQSLRLVNSFKLLWEKANQ